MAATALGIVGAVIGSFIPGVGTAFGFAIGSALGGVLFPENNELPDAYGPRLGDNKIQGASYGAALGRAYGTIRKAGSVIWSTPIIERANVQTVESGGKGGGGSEQTQTTYTYSASFAVAICETEIFGIRKIWANGELIYNVSSDSTVSGGTLIASSGIPITVYTGDETQLPDPIMESFLGAGNVPGYRGTAYAVLDNLQLATFGNRIPNLEFEVVSAGSATGPTETSIYHPSAQTINQTPLLSPSSSVLWHCTGPNAANVVNAYDLDNNTLLQQFSLGATAADHCVPLFVDSDNSLWAKRYGSGGSSDGLFRFTTGGVKTTFDMGAPSLPYVSIGYWGKDDNGNFWVASNSSTDVLKLSNFNESLFTGTATTMTDPFNTIQLFGNAGAIPGRMYCSSATNAGVIGFGYFNTDSNVFTLLATMSAPGPGRSMVDPSGYLYVSDGATKTTILKYDIDGNLIASCLFHAANTAINNLMLDGTGGLWIEGVFSSQQRIWRIDTASFTVTLGPLAIPDHKLIPVTSWNANAALTYSIVASSFEVFSIYNISTIASVVADLAAIVTSECALVGLSGSDIDVSDLVGIEVHGYLIAGRGPVRNVIQPLMQAHFFDAVESDYKIKFVTRGQSSIVTIPEDSLGAYSSNGDAVDTLTQTRKQETEVPVEITVKYYDRDRDYQEGAQISKRQTSLAQEKLTVSIPIAFNSDEARSNADALIFMAQMSRTSIAFATSREYSKYEPTDVVTIQKSLSEYLVRIIRRDEGVGGVIAWEGELEDTSVYTQNTAGASGLPPTGSVSYPGPTILTFLDIPMLRGSDNDPGLYTAAYGESDDWRGMQLYQSKDSGATYDALQDELQLTESTVGRASTALAMFGTVETNELFDEVSTVTIVLDSGELSSITRNEVLAGGNYAALKSGTGWEILQFKTATLSAADTYVLSGLLRGRLGTEWAMSGHVIGDRFVLLDIDIIREFPLNFVDLNLSYSYKAVSIDNTLAGTSQQVATSTGVRVKPLAPWHLAGGRTDTADLVIQWNRRSREPVIDWGSVSDPALMETSEVYSIDIMNGAAVVRTLSSSTQTVTYSAADQTTDFGSPQASVTVKVYQVSTEFGRGYPVTGTL